MTIKDIKEELCILRDIVHDEVSDSSCNDSYYFYVIYSYLFLFELKLRPILVRGVGRSWVEIISSKGVVYVVDLNFNNLIVKKEDSYLSEIGGTEIILQDFVDSWPDKTGVLKTKRWPKLMKPHSTFKSPPDMSKKPKTPKRPPQHAPIIRRHKTL